MQKSRTKRSHDSHMNSFDCAAQLSFTALCWKKTSAGHLSDNRLNHPGCSAAPIANHPRRWRAEGSKTMRACQDMETAMLTCVSAINHVIRSVQRAFHVTSRLRPTKSSRAETVKTRRFTHTKQRQQQDVNSRFSSQASFYSSDHFIPAHLLRIFLSAR